MTGVRHLGGFEKVREAAIGVSGCRGAPVRPSYHAGVLDTDVVVDVSTPPTADDEHGCG